MDASISADGLTLYFDSDRPNGWTYNIFLTTRPTKNDPWGPAVEMGPEVNGTGNYRENPWISADSLELYFDSDGGSGSSDIYVARRATANDRWRNAVNLGPVVNSPYGEFGPCLSPDGLLLLFFDYGVLRPGGYGSGDMWMARRATLSDPWQAPVNLGPKVNGPQWDYMPRLSPDGRTLYFVSTRGGSINAWQAPIIPNCDFNGDGRVDIQDLLILIEHWGQNYPRCDIGPFPWGDGKVDERDLEVFMSYWGQESGLLAWWKLDETCGMIATDSAGTNDGTLIGNPTWQPTGGKVKGALQFDGIHDYVSTPFVVDPAQGPFSVFAWVKGGGPGQVILSQTGGANWLMTGSSDGVLMTDLKATGRQGKSLTSATVITDGAWHLVGLVWDGSNRILYLGDIQVGKDTQANLPSSSGSLCIGAGANLVSGSFWKGLIDDVRIYNYAVKP